MTEKESDRCKYDRTTCELLRIQGVGPIDDCVRREIRKNTTDGDIADRAYETFVTWLHVKGMHDIDCNQEWWAWLRKAIKYHVLNAVDWCKIRRSEVPDPSVLTGQSKDLSVDSQELVRYCISKMDRKHRDALLLSWYGGLSNLEIAEILGRDPGDTSRLREEAWEMFRECAKSQLIKE